MNRVRHSAVMQRPRRPAYVLLAVVAVLAGCGGDDDGDAADAARPGVDAFLLTRADLPAGYVLDTRERSTSPRRCPIEFDTATRRRFAELGAQRCAIAKFNRDVAVSEDTTEFNMPTSDAVVMRDERAASDGVRLIRRTIIANLRDSFGSEMHSLAAPGLGDEAPRGLQADVEDVFDMYVYVWRRGNVVAWVSSTDNLDDFDARSTLALARRLDARGAG